MFLCRPGRRLSAAALDHTSAGWFIEQVKAQTSRDATLTLRKGGTFRAHRCFCVSAGDSGHPGRQRAQPQPVRDSPAAAPGLTDRAHWNRVTAVALNLSQTAQSSGFIGQPLVHASRRLSSGREPAGNVLFTGHFGLSMHSCFSGTMQSRDASTKSRDAGETDIKEENLKADSVSSTSSPKTSNQPDEPGGGKPNKTQQLKKVFKEYGAVGVSFHICISLMSLGMFYLLISSGVDMAAVLCKLGFSEAIVRSKMAAGTSTFVLAYAIHKLFAPARISITLVSVPLIVRYFRKTGLFKSRTPSP